MRSYLMGTSAGTRPRMESARSLSGSIGAGFGLPAGVVGAAHVFALGGRGRALVEGEWKCHGFFSDSRSGD